MSPLSASRIIPTGWSSYHGRVIPTSMNASVTVGAPEGDPVPVGDDFEQQYSDEYTGPARIQALNDSQVSDSAGQAISGRSYLVQLDMGLAVNEIRPGMRVKVTAAVNDAQLVGQDLWVLDPQFGSERFTRDVVCSDNQTDVPST